MRYSYRYHIPLTYTILLVSTFWWRSWTSPASWWPSRTPSRTPWFCPGRIMEAWRNQGVRAMIPWWEHLSKYWLCGGFHTCRYPSSWMVHSANYYYNRWFKGTTSLGNLHTCNYWICYDLFIFSGFRVQKDGCSTELNDFGGELGSSASVCVGNIHQPRLTKSSHSRKSRAKWVETT